MNSATNTKKLSKKQIAVLADLVASKDANGIMLGTGALQTKRALQISFSVACRALIKAGLITMAYKTEHMDPAGIPANYTGPTYYDVCIGYKAA